jgi:Piwi domain
MSDTPQLTLNIAPVGFSHEMLRIGRIPYTDEDAYRTLREAHRQTHTFRYDQRTTDILNVSLRSDVDPIGEISEVDLSEHLLLAAKAIQQSLTNWLAGRRPIIKGGKRLVFWGQRDETRLLSQALRKLNMTPLQDIEVYHRYDIDCRMFWNKEQQPYLGLVISVDTANVIDCSVAELIARGMSVIGRCVCQRREIDHPFLQPALDILGQVDAVHGTRLTITGADGTIEVDADEVIIEPRLENLHDAITAFCGAHAPQVLTTLRQLRQSLNTATGQLKQIRATLAGLQRQRFLIAPDVEVCFGELLQADDARFPASIKTERPPLLFGPQGRNGGLYPDPGIGRYGPYLSMQHTRNAPLIAVICEAQYRGRVEQFLKSLVEGYPDELWTDERKENPFVGGLIGKFRLARVQFEIEECRDTSPASYRAAVRRLLSRLPQLPDLALVQIREEYKQLYGDYNPYYVAKAALMSAGVPMQGLRIELIETPGMELAYALNNVALATYAKIDGVPWVISTRGPANHELVIGIGSTEITERRWGPRSRYVGLTTMFQGDGRYLVWEITRDAVYEEYTQALLESLQSALRYVQQQNGWQPNDKVRLVCHAYKRLKNCEVDAIKTLVHQLVTDQFQVEFAFLDITRTHPYHLVDPAQAGVTYWGNNRRRTKGQGVPERGLCLQLDRRRALLHLTGPKDVKTAEQGLPQPLLVELHSDSDFTDLTYLLRQIYHFTYMSWRSFFPATEPVTILYSRLIAQLLGNLRSVNGWESTALTMGVLRGRRWFL